jgi:hypothetical protein
MSIRSDAVSQLAFNGRDLINAAFGTVPPPAPLARVDGSVSSSSSVGVEQISKQSKMEQQRLPTPVEKDLDSIHRTIMNLWSQGPQLLEDKCLVVGPTAARMELERDLREKKRALGMIEAGVREFLASSCEERARAALRHLVSLRSKLASIENHLGPPLLPDDAGQGKFECLRVPADNSCLFHCLKRAFATMGENGGSPLELRRRCASFVESKSQALKLALGDDFVSNYSQQILDSNTWGGAVELSIFCEIEKGAQVVVFDIEAMSEEVFGSGEGLLGFLGDASNPALSSAADTNEQNTLSRPPPRKRAYLLYEGGNHYDLLMWSPGEGPGARAPGQGLAGQLLFSPSDSNAERRARRAASKLSTSRMWRVAGERLDVGLMRETSWE